MLSFFGHSGLATAGKFQLPCFARPQQHFLGCCIVLTASKTRISCLICWGIEHGAGEQEVKILGISSANLADFRIFFHGCSRQVIQLSLEGLLWVQKAHYLLFNSVYELEDQVYDTLKATYSLPIYSIGPAIQFFELEDNFATSISPNDTNYLRWLDSQPASSVSYVSLGSFLSVSSEQMDEITAGLKSSGARFLWVARGETSRLKKSCGVLGFIVPWCHQLKVLYHSSIAGFWTHCG